MSTPQFDDFLFDLMDPSPIFAAPSTTPYAAPNAPEIVAIPSTTISPVSLHQSPLDGSVPFATAYGDPIATGIMAPTSPAWSDVPATMGVPQVAPGPMTVADAVRVANERRRTLTATPVGIPDFSAVQPPPQGHMAGMAPRVGNGAQRYMLPPLSPAHAYDHAHFAGMPSAAGYAATGSMPPQHQSRVVVPAATPRRPAPAVRALPTPPPPPPSFARPAHPTPMRPETNNDDDLPPPSAHLAFISRSTAPLTGLELGKHLASLRREALEKHATSARKAAANGGVSTGRVVKRKAVSGGRRRKRSAVAEDEAGTEDGEAEVEKQEEASTLQENGAGEQ